MPDIRDPFDDLRRPSVPLVPRPEFAASLFDRLREEFGMTSTDEAQSAESTQVAFGGLAMVHLRVARCRPRDAVLRCAVRLAGRTRPVGRPRQSLHDQHDHDDPDPRRSRSRRQSCRTTQLPTSHAPSARSVAAADAITESEPAPDGGGWARGVDDQGLPLLVYRPGALSRARRTDARPHPAELGLVFIRADVSKAAAFYGEVLGWTFTPAHPGSHYFDTVAGVGVFDEAAAFGQASSRRPRCTSASTPCCRCCSRSKRSAARRETTRKTWAPTSRPCAPTIRGRRSA